MGLIWDSLLALKDGMVRVLKNLIVHYEIVLFLIQRKLILSSYIFYLHEVIMKRVLVIFLLIPILSHSESIQEIERRQASQDWQNHYQQQEQKILESIQREERDTLYREFYLQRLRRDNAIIINENINSNLNSNPVWWRRNYGWR